MATGRIGTTPALGFRWSIEPAGGTTSLSGLDNNSVGLSYTPGNERVYRNGVLLSRVNDYTATSGNSITLNDATVAGDIIEVFSQDLTQLADTVAKSTLTAKGQVLTATAASTPAVLTVGANGTVLTADSGETTGLRWGVAGGLTEIASASFTTGAVSFTSIPATYKNLVIVGVNLSEANGNNSGVRVRFNNDTGNNYTFAFTSAGATGNASSGVSGMKVQADQIIANSSIYVHIDRYKDTNHRPIWFMGSGSNSGWCVRGAGNWNNNAAITRVDVDLISTGTFGAITGTIYLFGVN